MASPQIEKGYTRLANELLEALCRCRVSRRELSIMLAVIRLTYGWNRATSIISQRALERVTEIDRRNVQRLVKGLHLKRMLIVKIEGQIRYVSINKNYDQWEIWDGKGGVSNDAKGRLSRSKRGVSNDAGRASLMTPERASLPPPLKDKRKNKEIKGDNSESVAQFKDGENPRGSTKVDPEEKKKILALIAEAKKEFGC